MERTFRFVLSSGFWVLGSALFLAGCSSTPKVSSLNQKFASFPGAGLRQKPVLPTDNDKVLRGELAGYVAQTGVNENYGMPGWSRNNGTRFHEGVDIKPVSWVATKQKMKVQRKDSNGRLVTRWESVRAPKDKVYAVLDGVVVVASTNPAKSGYGKYVMIEHSWADGSKFCTLYAHLSSVSVREGQAVSQGAAIGVMGQTAKDAASRVYLRANPHMHFEVGRLITGDPIYSNRYDPRNLQPYHPIEFFRNYGAISRTEWAAARRKGAPMLATVAPR